jgi:hypothetical protein
LFLKRATHLWCCKSLQAIGLDPDKSFSTVDVVILKVFLLAQKEALNGTSYFIAIWVSKVEFVLGWTKLPIFLQAGKF